MKKKVDLWIDHRKTVIVFLVGEEEEIKEIKSNVEKQIQRAAGSRSGGPFESQAVPSDDRQQRKFTAHLNTYYNEIISCIRDAESILIFGPGESAWDPPDLLRIIDKDAADGLFIKVAKAGGISRARKWVAIARAAGLSVSCGCMTGSGFEAAAQAHFLISDEWTTRFVQENTGPLTVYNILNTVDEDITTDLAKKLPRYENGFMWVPEGPGLGVELNEDVVPQYLTRGKQPVTVTA